MKDKMINVLIFPAGVENGIEIWNSLKDVKFINLYGCSDYSKNHSEFIFKNVIRIKNVKEFGWLSELNEVIEKYKIDYIFPANSIVIDSLNDNRDLINAEILLPSKETIINTRSKKRTFLMLEDFLFIPKLYNDIESVEFPAFAKPDKGYGGQGGIKIDSKDQLKSINLSEYIIQEYLPGEEYTIDCFTKKNGEILFLQGRTRERIRMGTSMHSEIVDDSLNEEFYKIAKILIDKFKIFGAWFFQMKRDKKGDLKLLEIDLRIAGTMALNRVRGINFPLLHIYEFLGIDTSIMFNKNIKVVIDRCLKNRYLHNIEYDTVYVDLDDTLILKGKLNTELIKFLYQCVNNNYKIILLTKSNADNVNDFLKNYKIVNLFDKIIHIKEEDKKYKYIDRPRAIFIDDSFSQRKEVYENCKIPTFDCSMIEMLLDDRI